MAAFHIHEDAENQVKIHGRRGIGAYKNQENNGCDKENKTVMVQFCKSLNAGHSVIGNEFKRCTFLENKENLQSEANYVVKEVERDGRQEEKPHLDTVVTKLGKEEDGVEAVTAKREENGCFPVSLLHDDEYRKDIWRYYLETERCFPRPRTNYMQRQLSLTWGMRSILVDWLVSVAEEYTMSEHTLHLAVNYVDRFLSQISVVREKFQLVGAAAMMLAGKMEEIYPPDTAEWAYLTGDTYTKRQLLKMEQLILKVLNFRLQPPTMLTFIQHLCIEHKLDNTTMHLAMYLSELVLLEGQHYLEHVPSLLGAASVALARFTLAKKKPWTPALQRSSGYTLKQLSPVVQRQQRTFRESPHKTNQAIQSKYKRQTYYSVAYIKPKVLLMDDLEE